ncbi:MAG TPA: SRPBCC domain-containing protein [Saprospiraceae bacterium]|nr:SRPBCC domain-containing protein [Saprospiraceae bacterium]
MERKTNLTAPDGKQEILIERIFDLPLNLLFLAYTKAELVEQWMGNKVIKWDHKDHGSYQLETIGESGNVLFRANGTIHKSIENQQIIRTFEMENSTFPVQLEFLEFESIDNNTSKLAMKIVYKSVLDRDEMLKLPFARGIHLAHNRIQQIISNLK